jgi:uncharacterized membrane protein
MLLLSDVLMKNPHAWLKNELPQWIRDGIIDSEQAGRILERYPPQHSLSWGKILISGFGAVMVGLGIILLFAYNWDQMGRFSKMAVILGALAITHFFAYRSWKTQQFHLAESLFVLATMLFGAGIWLVAQVYHLDEHYPNAFLLWGGGSLLLAWALPSLPQAIMTVGLLLIWHFSEVMDFDFAAHHSLLLILLGLFPLIWRLQSPVLARLVSASFFVSLGLTTVTVDEHLFGSSLVLIAASFIFFSVWTASRSDNWLNRVGEELAKPAYLVFIVMLFLLSFNDISDDLIRVRFRETAEYFYFYLPVILSQLLFALLVFRRQFSPIVFTIEFTVLLIIFPSLATGIYAGQFLTLVFNVLLLGLSIALIYQGSQHADTRKMVWGSLIFAVLVFARYTDLFDSLISRAIAFLVVGAVLFFVGSVFNRNRNKNRKELP